MKKKLIAILMATAMVATIFAGCSKSDSDKASSGEDTEYSVAMITDSGDITDQSFNQSTYEASKEFCEANGLKFQYFKPSEDTTSARDASVEEAIDNGFNVIVMPGYLFAGTIVDLAETYSDVKFIALDCSKGDLLEAALGDKYDYTPDNWDLEESGVYMDNVYCVTYQEELSGYLAGYAAVKLGYTKLGFMGGMSVPAVERYGYGFLQGADAAAAETGAAVDVQYAYGGTFGAGNQQVISACDTMYAGGTEVIFACGGSIFKDVCESAKNNGKKVIGVDSDQGPVIDAEYGEGMTVTSAMKGLAPTVKDTLDDCINNGNWAKYLGKIDCLGMVSGDDPAANYVQLGESTQFADGFTEDDYKALVASMFKGEVKVSNDITAMPKTDNITVKDLGTIITTD
ncbi:MAG: BMP family ABC transporter substrate-binding protein [Lachnospiraceae bacterium]|nr:BMP family ABC transporter substrate-binding protein [Lachnospiraceae bacterium]